MAAWRLLRRRSGVAVAAGDRERAVDAGGGQVAHQADEPGQVGRVDASLVEGEDVVAGGGAEREVGVLDAFGDAAEGDESPQVVLLQGSP